MRAYHRSLIACVLSVVVAGAAESRAAEIDGVAAAVGAGLQLVERAARNWPQHRQCFSCHHQTLPLFAAREAAQCGFAVEADWSKEVADFTRGFFDRQQSRMLGEEHVGGGSFTVGYGLWALWLEERPADEVTSAMVIYLLRTQGVARPEDLQPERASRLRDGPWLPSCKRPPLQSSEVAATVLALAGLARYGNLEQSERITAACIKAEHWLATAPLDSHEDLIWRLWGLHFLHSNDDTQQLVRTQLLSTQREDGGWAQEPELESDAYSTGQALYVLRLTGSPQEDAAVQRTVQYLLHTRCADGSWLVKTRVDPVQTYFDNGDPHAEHQFLSTSATCWAVAGLAQMLPRSAATSTAPAAAATSNEFGRAPGVDARESSMDP